MTQILFQSVTVSIKTFVRTQTEMGSHIIEKESLLMIFSVPLDTAVKTRQASNNKIIIYQCFLFIAHT